MSRAQQVEPVALGLKQLALVACSLGLLVPALLPCLITFSPDLHFDVDPRTNQAGLPAIEFGPTGAAWLHVLAVVAAIAAVAVGRWCGGPVHWFSVLAVAAGMTACGFHMTRSYPNLIQGGAWMGAAALGLGALHLGRHALARRWMAAALVAILLPIGLQAIWFVIVEHPMTVEHFHANDQAILESHGWQSGSPQHQLYIRRIESPDAIGSFGLSNVLGSIVAGLTLLSLASALGAHGILRILMLGISLFGLIVVGLTRSKGAVLTIPAGLVLIGLCTVIKLRPGWRIVLPIAAMSMIMVAVAVILVRGSLGPPPTQAGERSLLFRFFYAQAAVRMVALEPVVGVGPADFKSHYLQQKNPLSPEEVQSSHNVLLDFGSMLGLGGWAWCVLLISWVIAAARGVGRPAVTERSAGFGLDDRVVAGGLGAVLFITQYIVLWPLMRYLVEKVLLWLTGLAGFVLILWQLARADAIARYWQVAGLFVAAAMVLMHNQIEMTFYHAPSSGMVWLMVALAAGAAMPGSDDSVASHMAPTSQSAMHIRRIMAPLLLVVSGIAVVVAMVFGYALPVTTYQRQVGQVADVLRDRPLPEAIQQIDTVARMMPDDLKLLRWRVILRLQLAEAAVQNNHSDMARMILDQASALLAATRGHSLSLAALHRYRGQVQMSYVELLGDSSRLDNAALAMESLIAASPYDLLAHIRLAELYQDRLDRPKRARELYQRALELDAQSYLDSAKCLSGLERQQIEQRLKAGGESLSSD